MPPVAHGAIDQLPRTLPKTPQSSERSQGQVLLLLSSSTDS